MPGNTRVVQLFCRPVSVEAIDQELRGLIDEEDIALSRRAAGQADRSC